MDTVYCLWHGNAYDQTLNFFLQFLCGTLGIFSVFVPGFDLAFLLNLHKFN